MLEVPWKLIFSFSDSDELTHSRNQPSWQPLNQTSQLDSHPGSHSIKPASESWRPVGRLEGGVWGGCRPPQEVSDDGGGFPTTLDIWRSPGPTCPGTKYPVRESLTSINFEIRCTFRGHVLNVAKHPQIGCTCVFFKFNRLVVISG